jgi:hypothetical protein
MTVARPDAADLSGSVSSGLASRTGEVRELAGLERADLVLAVALANAAPRV